jgi:hypothetical protein
MEIKKCALLAHFITAIATWRIGNTPEVQHDFLVADDAKQAELKSGLAADPAWDFDYLTMFSRPICEVNVKEKVLEVAVLEKKRKTA